MTGQNVLLIVSDEHAREALGCYGADHVHTRNIDGSCQPRNCVPPRLHTLAYLRTGESLYRNRYLCSPEPLLV